MIDYKYIYKGIEFTFLKDESKKHHPDNVTATFRYNGQLLYKPMLVNPLYKTEIELADIICDMCLTWAERYTKQNKS